MIGTVKKQGYYGYLYNTKQLKLSWCPYIEFSPTIACFLAHHQLEVLRAPNP